MATPPPGRVALVTGGARGIGLASARTLAAEGHRVAVTYRHNPPAEAEDLLCIPCDVTELDQVESAFEAIEDALGPVEVLVSNAGITQDGLVLRMGEDAFSRVVDTNLTGGYRVAKRAVTKMVRARWGRLIFVGSVVGAAGAAGQANYAAAKAGLTGLARSLARELASRAITANVVAPGPIQTHMIEAITEDRRTAIADAVPLGRFGTVEEVAATIAFLASDDAAFITGAVIPVDGGLGMGS